AVRGRPCWRRLTQKSLRSLPLQVVDLRWGIRNVPSGDHEACEIFLQEIQTCQRVSAGPAFTVSALLGNRYGHRALPRLIPEKQFEVLLSKLCKNSEGVKQLNQWFLKDNNAVPPTYVLQPITAHFPHYSDLRPESRQQHDSHVLSWRLTETQLLQLLRSAATDSEAAGDITTEQKQHFHTSGENVDVVGEMCSLFLSTVTEREFEQGLWKDNHLPPALLFVREIPRQRVRDGPKRLAKFMDITADGLLDTEAQGLLSGLKSRLYATSQQILNLHCVELSRGSIDPKRKEHAQYLDSVCEQFVSQMKARIGAAVDLPEDVSTWVVEEVMQHVDMSVELSKGLHGREGLLGKLCLAMWESTNVRHSPLVVHGAAGIGKTALLCKLAQEMRSVLEAGVVVAIRLLADRHPQRLNIDHVLRSICLQVCLACGLAPPSPLTANTYLELLRFFRNVLADVSQQGNTLLIILDSLDQLSDQHHAHKLHWLPPDVPPNVHLVVSMDTNSEAFANMRLKLDSLESFFEVERLSHDDGKHIMESYLRASQRTLTSEQSDALLRSFEATGCPLHLKLMLSAAKSWTSFTPLTELRLGASTQEMMSQLFLMLEEKHGKELVGGALGYIALARDGLLEGELRDVMSLDDNVLSEVYKYSLPPTPSMIRLPPLLWARLRRDLEDQLEERWSGGVVAVAFNSRRLSEAVSARYLTSERRGRCLRILAEYFLGRWAGKLKPVALPDLSLLLSDRKVPPQPLWFAPGLANIRKLQELPYHLLHAGLWDELQQQVIGSAEWLYCKSRVCGVSSVIHDLDQCSQYMDCTEAGLIRDALVLIKPSLDFLEGHMDMSLFYTELLARLASLAAAFPTVIGQLCSQCEEWLLSCPEPVLIPKTSFLQQPGGALQHTLTALQGGQTFSIDFIETKLLVAGSDDGAVAVWSLADKQLIHTLLGHTGSHFCLLSQVKVWRLDGSELHLCSSSDEAWLVLGVLGESVVSLSNSGQVRLSHAANGTQTVKPQLENLANSLTPVISVSLPKRGKVFVVSKEGFLHQVRFHLSDGHLAAISFLPLQPQTEEGVQKLLLTIQTLGQQPTESCAALPAGSLSERLAVSAQVCCLELAQHKRLLLCGLTSGTVLIYPLALPQETLCIPPPESLSRVLCLAVSSQEKHMAVAYEDSVCVFEITTRDSFPTVEGPLQRFSLSLLHAPLSSMALLPDRKLLYGTSCGEVKLHDFDSGGNSNLEPHRSRVTCVTGSNWGTHALVGSEDAVQRLWALNPLALDHTMEYKVSPTSGVLSAAFSDSDQFVFTGSQDRTVKVWDVASGKLLYVQYVYSPVVRMVTFRNGFVALSQQGSVIKEVFRCPDHISPDYNPLRNVKAQYRVTSREKSRDDKQDSVSDLQDFNPAQFNLNLMSMLRAKPSSTCVIL
uniref:NACHT and WD repeat domain containing 1 n=1 Tax=Stegastes partitus TaxID=144197 RepID=A0A3B5ARN5_9TELE